MPLDTELHKAAHKGEAEREESPREEASFATRRDGYSGSRPLVLTFAFLAGKRWKESDRV